MAGDYKHLASQFLQAWQRERIIKSKSVCSGSRGPAKAP